MDASIVIPYHDRKRLFLNQLRSLLEQDHPSGAFEIVLVEDGSNDFVESRPDCGDVPFRYVWKPKKDAGRHTPPRNEGIAAASGDIVIFLDCDQVVGPDFVREHVEFHRLHGPDVLQIGTRKEMHPNQDGIPLSDCTWDEDVRRELFRRYRSDGEGLSAMWANVWSHNISIRRDNLARFGGFDEDFVHWGLEDQEFGLRMSRNGIRIRHNPAIEVFHQYHKPAWGSRIDKGWQGNFGVLRGKYPDDPRVSAISLLGDILEPTIGSRIRPERIRELSLLYYTKVELVVRCLEGRADLDQCLEVLPESDGPYFRGGVW